MAMCGPSSAETIAQGETESLSRLMAANYQERFQQQGDLLSRLNLSLQPVLAGGPEQQGFSAEELAAKNTSAINSAAAANRNAQQVAGNEIAGQNNTSGLESGITRAIKAGISTNVGNELANAQNTIVQQNYDTGRANYKTALAGSEALSGEYNPAQFGSEAQSGLATSFGEADKINTQQQALGKDLFSAGIAGLGLVSGGFGNLDTTGSSTAGEQALNFFGGMKG
jgi:hypothetical protein